MWAIRGYFSWDDADEVVCTFDTEEAANAYLNAAKLKAPKWKHKYRVKSGLAHYDSCYVEYIEVVEHNPTITF